MSIFFLVPLFLFIIILYKLLQKPASNLPPGPIPWPIIGNLRSIKQPLFRCYSDWSQRYGPILSVWFGSSLNIVVSTSELAEQVLKEHDHHLANRHRNAKGIKYSEDGSDLTWADYGPHYVKLRKICALEIFSPKSLEALRPIREDEVMAMVESIYNFSTSTNNTGKRLVLRKFIKETTFNFITRMVLGKRFEIKESKMDEQLSQINELIGDVAKLGRPSLVEYIPWLKWINRDGHKSVDDHKARRERLTRAIMEEHTVEDKARSNSTHCFLNALLKHQLNYDISNNTIISLVWDIINAGIETSPIVVEWAMTEVLKNPNVQVKAHNELDRVIGSHRALTESDLVNLPYIQCIVKETLRLHPATPLMLPHKAHAKIKIGGYDIPAGTTVHVNVWALGRDPDQWADPLDFCPERFIEDDVDMKGHDFRLLPFGAGRRVCPGAQLGINLVSLMLGQLLHHFSWSIPKGVEANEIDMMEMPGLVAFMRTPLEALTNPRIRSHEYKSYAN